MLPSLLTPNKLKSLLKVSGTFYDKFRIVETNLGDNFREAYKNGHIDKAVYLNSLECTEPSQLYPRNLPKPELFKDYVGSLGISNKHHLILYDRSQFGFYTSSRMWWIFRLFGHEQVSILDGGLRLWLLQNNHLETDLPDFKPENFEIKPNNSLLRTYEDILSNKELVVDVRGSNEFNFEHIPGSINLPYSKLFDPENNKLKDPEELKTLFSEKGLDLDKPFVASCMTGMTACSLALAAHLLGKTQVPVYYGSWAEYSQRKNN